MAANATKSLAAQPPWQTALRSLNWSELSVPVAVLGIVLAMITPLPPILLDVLISANITMSIVILLSAMYITKPSEFNVFPTMLLLMTLFRLALNISSSRLILLQGNTGTRAAGDVIESFGSFVVGGNYVIGTVVFLVLIAIQYVVINHGAVRISEVTARFTLDAMPGKQMSIDSDLNAGLIDESQARARRKALAAEAEFYGAMDGASRFTQRDAIASILITAINIVAGFLIGVLQHGMDLQRALQTYTVLTIGDGLVTVIPALMISVCGGLIVTRASSDSKLGADVRLQIFSKSQPLLLAGGVLLAMALFPGLPKIPFIVLGAGAGYAGWTLRTAEAKKSKAPAQTKQAKAAENLENLLKVEAVAIEVGLGLVRMVEGGQNSLLLSRISMIRKQLASEVGYLLPPVRVTDNLQLKAREYIISIKGLEVARYELQAGCEMAIQPAQPAAVLPTGVTTKEPAFNMPAVWINPDQVEKAKQLGYTVVDPVSVVGTHFTEVIRKYAAELLTRQETKRILDRVGQDNGKLIEDLVPKQISLATVQKVLQNLLRERISIRDVVTILEALGEAASLTKNVVLMTEFVRQSIKRSIVRPLLSGSDLTVYFVDNEIEKKIEGATEHGEYSSHLNLPPQEIRLIMDKFQRVFTATQSNSVVLSSASCRYFLRQVLENSLPALSIISHNELPPGVRVVSLGTVK
ncbi:MAG: flagellar biosynthesis protein FlhA [Bryobacteraceae bacterium]